jgi:hypothetical protein
MFIWNILEEKKSTIRAKKRSMTSNRPPVLEMTWKME